MRYKTAIAFAGGLISGLLLAIPLLAQSILAWQQKEVTPLIAVRANMGEFIVDTGTALGPTWKKEQVTPMIAVRPSGDAFVPKGAAQSSISWEKSEVKPVIFVKYAMGNFVPAE
jgi:hypothetical protein